MGKAYSVSFEIAGKMASSFSSSFTSASRKVDELKRDARDLKSELRKLDSEFKKGKIGTDQYNQAQARLYNQIDKNIAQQRRYSTLQKRQREMAASTAAFFDKTKSNAKQAFNIAALGTTAVAAGTAFSSVKKAMSFEEELSTIKALTGASNEEMQKMHDLAIKMGAKTKYNALESAQGIEELLKAGLKPATVQSGALEAALNLATAGGLGLADAATIMSTALNAYKADNLSAAQASNILAGTANASATEVAELQYGLAQVSAVASGVGMTFKDTNVALGLFANNGLKGSDAGTSLKTMLSRLVPQTNDQYEAFSDLGLITQNVSSGLKYLSKNGIKPADKDFASISAGLETLVTKMTGAKKGTKSFQKEYDKLAIKSGFLSSAFYDNEGSLQSLDSIAGSLKNSLSGLTDQQRQQYLYTMFGSDAIRAANILYKEGAKGVKEFNQEMSHVTALQVAEEKMNNASGAIEQMSGAFETLQIIGAETTLPLIKDAATNLADIFERNTDNVKAWSQSFSDGMHDVFEPFITVKPKKPKFDGKHINPEIQKEYEKQLAKYNMFDKMDFGDKVIYSLDKAAEKMEDWVDGPGGDTVNRIFTKLAEIGINAWAKALKGALEGAVGQAFQGNFAAAGGLALASNFLTGGLVFGAGKWALKKGGSKAKDIIKGQVSKRKSAKSVAIDPPVSKTKKQTKSNNNKSKPKAKNQSSVAPKNTKTSTKAPILNDTKLISKGKKVFDTLGKAGKVLGKVALPAAIATEAYDIYKSNDKVKATAKAAGGLGGGWGGATGGAAIGTAIFPGVGTVLGGLVGGIGGYIGGKWFGGKAVDTVREYSGQSASESSAPSNVSGDTAGTAINQATAELVENINLASFNFSTLTMYVGQASGWVASLYGIQADAANVKLNMGFFASYLGQASGWVASLYSIQTDAANIKLNSSILASYLGQASGWIASLYGFQNNAANAKLNASILASYLGQASGWVASLYGFQSSAANAKNNASILASYLGQASGWVASLYGIQNAASNIKSALNSLRNRINSVSVPSKVSGSSGATPVQMHAKGGIFDKPHLGVFAEAGPESFIPIKKNNQRSLSIWQKTGQMLGAGSLIKKSQNLTPVNQSHVTVVYSPSHVINGGNRQEVEAVLKSDQADFEKFMKQYEHDKKRRTF